MTRRQPSTRLRFNRRLFRWHDHGRRPLLIRDGRDAVRRSWSPRSMSQQTGDRASRPGLATVHRAAARRRRSRRRPATRRASSRPGQGSATTGVPWPCGDAARAIVADHEGRVPGDGRGARATAGGRPVHGPGGRGDGLRRCRSAPLDVNTRRVVSRVLGVPSTLARSCRPRGRPRLARAARSLDSMP